MDYISLTVFVFAFYATPGPATLSLAASGSSVGFRRSVPYLIGILSGLSVNLVVSVSGMSFIFTRWPSVVVVMKYIALIYILYLAWVIARSPVEQGEAVDGPGFMMGLLLNTLNPKAYLAAIAMLTQFISDQQSYWPQAITILAITLLLTTVIDTIWVFVGDGLGRLIQSQRYQRILNYIFAVLLVVSVLLAILASE